MSAAQAPACSSSLCQSLAACKIGSSLRSSAFIPPFYSGTLELRAHEAALPRTQIHRVASLLSAKAHDDLIGPALRRAATPLPSVPMRVVPRFRRPRAGAPLPLASMRTSSVPVWKSTDTGRGLAVGDRRRPRLLRGLSSAPSNLTVTLHLPHGPTDSGCARSAADFSAALRRRRSCRAPGFRSR